jgi:hypothetical protein
MSIKTGRSVDRDTLLTGLHCEPSFDVPTQTHQVPFAFDVFEPSQQALPVSAATAFYSATLVFTSTTFNLTWWLGRRERALLVRELPQLGLRTITIRYAVALVCYIAATGIAFINVWISLSIHLVLALWNGLSEQTRRTLS